MPDRDTRYQPLELNRLEEQIEDLENEDSLQPQYRPPVNDFKRAPNVRGRTLRRILLVSVALNAILVMVATWQYLKLRSLALGCGTREQSSAKTA